MDHSDPSSVVGVDVGSKYCHLRELLAEKGLQCYHLDVCPREDKRGMVVGNGRRIPFKDSYLDFMVTSHVLAHIDILVEFLSEASRVLKPRGRLYILQSNGLGWWKFWGYYIVRNDRKAPFRTFTWWGIRRWLTDGGFIIERASVPYFFYLHGKWSDVCYRFDRTKGPKTSPWLSTQWLISAQRPGSGKGRWHPLHRPSCLTRMALIVAATNQAVAVKALELIVRRMGKNRPGVT